jgi:hypothetical protein
MRSRLSESVIVTKFQAAEIYLCFDLAKAKYRISNSLRWKKKMLFCELALVISVNVLKENRHDDENEIRS